MRVTYVHIMFDQHEVVFSDGLATESFYTGDQAMAALAPAARAEIKAHKSEKRALLA